MMAMFFHFGVKESAILFSGWKTNDWQGVLGSCIGIFILGVIYEGLKSYRESVFIKLSYFYRNQTSRSTAHPPIHPRVLFDVHLYDLQCLVRDRGSFRRGSRLLDFFLGQIFSRLSMLLLKLFINNFK
ncbi:uncharacterized protein LOC141533818 isoform X3 [Cotesia typhae]|uniref:uncharacterized protein LOC141533818 isoform X3 n=1 Tax=Cotesia typhae TaxID=2053667 RepID=UPI003D69BE5E